VLHRRLRVAHGGDHHRQPGRHGLEHGDGDPLAPARQRPDIADRQQVTHILADAQYRHERADPQRFGPLPKKLTIAWGLFAPGKKEMHITTLCLALSQCLN